MVQPKGGGIPLQLCTLPGPSPRPLVEYRALHVNPVGPGFAADALALARGLHRTSSLI